MNSKVSRVCSLNWIRRNNKYITEILLGIHAETTMKTIITEISVYLDNPGRT